ncbi:MAG TPA: DUF302 domain-containing protein [Acidobacteriota bacterium]|nr:DUF302 domain-containing protein [Acidobacteriota bacterium]HOT00050.1 DUF302 domain-containing protein [Acidobacteriota bacterium]HQF87157.1 DUF302 domain-containing protein [Acidobacteriota bacterium]HQG91718.1 DUF302 domain-containing protein [Acidobacteriota bacterium]HQK87201.1 DUF302 domain-containing protein [Acidobacteriota bacterium]
MPYYFNKTVQMPFPDVVAKVMDGLAAEGFGVLSDIDVKATMKRKLDIEFQNYRILGACNPPFAYRALQIEDKIGTLMPCNVIVQERTPGTVEVAAVNPMVSMQAVDKPELREVAEEVTARLRRVIDRL